MHVTTWLPHAVNCVRFCFSAVCDYFLFFFHFVCESYISGTAERSCTKFTGKTCLVPRLDEFECQGQRSRSQGQKTRCALPSPLAAREWNALAANNVKHQQTGPFCHCWRWCRQLACSLFGKTSLAARVVLWLDHSDAMCSRAWRALCSAGSRFDSSRGLGKAHPPT